MIQLSPNVESGIAVSRRSKCGRGGIAVLLPAFKGGGAQRDIVLLCNALAEKGVSVTILVLRNEGPLKALVDPTITIAEIPGRRIRYAVPGVRRAIRSIAPALVLSSESNMNLFCLAAIRSLPPDNRPRIVLREVSCPSLAEKCDPHWQNRIAYRALRHFYRYADQIITLTEGARRDLVENFFIPDSKVAVMNANAVIAPETLDRLAKWDGEQGREADLIVCVARLSPEKNHRLLFRALARLAPDRPWRLAVVGDGRERRSLETFVRDNGLAPRTTFVGYDSDPFGWLMRARVSICSSNFEGLCNVIIEALGCGTPVISTDCPFGPREILQGGRYGTLVPVDDVAALSSAIDAALDQTVDRAYLMERSLHYTAEHAAENFLDIVGDL